MKQPFDFNELTALCFLTHEQCRSFYLSYQAISQTLSDQSLSVHSERSIFLEQAGDLLMPKFTLSWSHYITLLILDNPNERRFYELEATAKSITRI